MAKGNPILGTASKSIGDIVLYRREGTQVSRVRVRKIANPKTDAQCLQRAFMSACVKFYQPLANVLDRSWQGKSRAKSYAAFLKANAPKVRAAGYYLPKGTGFYPLPLQLSEGTLQPLSILGVTDQLVVSMPVANPQAAEITTIGALSALFKEVGYHDDDVVTVILVTRKDPQVLLPVSYQFAINENSTETVASVFGSIRINVAIDNGGVVIFGEEGDAIVAGTIIVARNVDGVWQRSKQTMMVSATVLATITSDAAKTACIDSYKGAAASDNPLVYLDGDELTD